MTHLGDITKIDGGKIEPVIEKFLIAVTRRRVGKEDDNAKAIRRASGL